LPEAFSPKGYCLVEQAPPFDFHRAGCFVGQRRRDETILKHCRHHSLRTRNNPDTESAHLCGLSDIGDEQMQNENNQAKVMEFAEIWHAAQLRRMDDIASDISILKTVGVFCGVGLLVSLVLASYGWDLGSSFF
jgi:hypothetical protein